MSKYRVPMSARVEFAKRVQERLTGVSEVQCKHSLPSVDEWVANGGVIEYCPSFGDAFPIDYRVPHG